MKDEAVTAGATVAAYAFLGAIFLTSYKLKIQHEIRSSREDKALGKWVAILRYPSPEVLVKELLEKKKKEGLERGREKRRKEGR